MQNLHADLETLLSGDAALVDEAGKLNKNVLMTRAANLDAAFLARLLSSDPIRRQFFVAVGETLVFDKVRFQEFVANKAFLPDSYTAFRNRIGLALRQAQGSRNHGFLSESEDVVLAWPYKDCVLEGGMTREDTKRDELFWNTTLAPDDITRLFEPKALTGFERWDAKAVAGGSPKPVGRIDPASDNLLIKGNNLLALHSLKRRYAGQVKLIYIDPPYNTGGDGFRYNDRFNHSAWLTFMRNRLEVAKALLRPDGAIFVNLDDNEAHYAKVLMDEVFGRENFVANVIWQKRYAPDVRVAISDAHEFLLCFAKVASAFADSCNLIPLGETQIRQFRNPDNDIRGVWKASDFTAAGYRVNQMYEIVLPSGRSVFPPAGRCWRVTEEGFGKFSADGRMYYGPNGDSVPALKRFLSEMTGLTPWTWWPHTEVGHSQEGKNESQKLFGRDDAFSTPKPERLIERVLQVGSRPNDLVLDFFLGSGTTAAVAHKMGRRWIGVDQMDYVETVAKVRLHKVIAGEQGGISKAQNWTGGGSFVYLELAEDNEALGARIRAAGDDAALERVAADLRERGWWRYSVDQDAWDWSEWAALRFDARKQLLLDSLDANHLYVNLGDIDDSDAGLSADDIAVTKAFYEDDA